MNQQQHAEIYEALREFIHRFGSMADKAIVELPGHTSVAINIQARGDTDAETIRAIDVLAWEVLEDRAETRQLDLNTWHRSATGNLGPVHVAVFAGITSPEMVRKDGEIARLEAEVAELRAARETVDAVEFCGATT